MKVVIGQKCHIKKDGFYQDGVVIAIYDEWIIIKKQYGKKCRVKVDEIEEDRSVDFLHKDGNPVMVKKGLWGYKWID